MEVLVNLAELSTTASRNMGVFSLGGSPRMVGVPVFPLEAQKKTGTLNKETHPYDKGPARQAFCARFMCNRD